MVSDEPGLRGLTTFAMLCGGGKHAHRPPPQPGPTDSPSSARTAVALPHAEAASAEEVQDFEPLCGPEHEPCSAVPRDPSGLPTGVWDVENCAGGDRYVCFFDDEHKPALFLDESSTRCGPPRGG